MKRLFFIGTAVFAVACQAGIKYWDNPAYKAYHSGDTYTYTEGSSPATVRLTWKGKPDGLSITIR